MANGVMRILFLTDHYLDYTSDPLYVGLSKVLGETNVIDYPYKASFHESEAVPWYLVPHGDRRWNEPEILDLLRDGYFDLACIASFRKNCLEEFSRLYRQVPFPPIVFVDGSDGEDIRLDVLRNFPICVHFKRDYVWGMGNGWKDRWDRILKFRGDTGLFARTVPMPLSIVLEALPILDDVEKDIDVSYRGRGSHPCRAKAIKILSGMKDLRLVADVYASSDDRQYKLKGGRIERLWTKFFNNKKASKADQLKRLTPETYYKEIAASRIAIALRGGGRTPSLRFYEIVALKTLLVSDAPEAVIPKNFINGYHAVFCKPNLTNLSEVIRYYLREKEEREAMINNAYAHLIKYHTCERRAEYFLENCIKYI